MGSPLISQGFSCDTKCQQVWLFKNTENACGIITGQEKKSICLENIHQAGMLTFRAPHLLLATHSCESKGAPWEPPNCGMELAEMGPCSHFPLLFLLGCLGTGFCVRWDTQCQVCSSWTKLLLFEGIGMMGSFSSTGIKWRLSTNLNWFDGFSPFD